MVDWKSVPPLAALRAFDAAARELSFSAGARRLNVTPAAIAQQVRALERDLGVSLAVRDGRGLALTPEGDLLARALDRGFRTIAETTARLRERTRPPGVRVMTTMNIASEFIFEHMAGFWQRAPGTEVSLMPVPGYPPFDGDAYDLAVRGGSGPHPDLVSTHLAETRWVALGRPDVLGDDPVDLKKLRWIVNPEFSLEAEMMRLAGLDPDVLDTVRLGTPGFMINAVREGLGAAVANAFIARKDLASGRLRAVELSGVPRWSYWALTPDRPRRDVVTTFMSWLEEIFAAEIKAHPQAGATPI